MKGMRVYVRVRFPNANRNSDSFLLQKNKIKIKQIDVNASLMQMTGNAQHAICLQHTAVCTHKHNIVFQTDKYTYIEMYVYEYLNKHVIMMINSTNICNHNNYINVNTQETQTYIFFFCSYC